MRRASGEGSIGRRPNGLYYATIQVSGRRQFVYGRTQSEVVGKLRELQQAARTGRMVEPTRLTVAEYFDQWSETVRPTLRPSTWANYRDVITCHISPALGQMKLTALRPLHLATLYSKRSQSGLSPARIRKIHQVLHKALADAVKWRLLASNPATDAPAPRLPKAEPPVWSVAETMEFLAWAQRYERNWDGLWLFLIGSGLRLGEALALTWTDVDLDAGTVTVSRSLTHVHGRLVEGAPKSAAGTRAISLPAFAIQALRQQRQRRIGARVFLSQSGDTPTRSSLRKLFQATCRAAGVPEVPIHSLRRVHATLAVRAGADVKVLQRRLGHASLTLTLNTYARAVSDADRDTAAGLDRLLTGQPAKRARRR